MRNQLKSGRCEVTRLSFTFFNLDVEFIFVMFQIMIKEHGMENSIKSTG